MIASTDMWPPRKHERREVKKANTSLHTSVFEGLLKRFICNIYLYASAEDSLPDEKWGWPVNCSQPPCGNIGHPTRFHFFVWIIIHFQEKRHLGSEKWSRRMKKNNAGRQRLRPQKSRISSGARRLAAGIYLFRRVDHPAHEVRVLSNALYSFFLLLSVHINYNYFCIFL